MHPIDSPGANQGGKKGGGGDSWCLNVRPSGGGFMVSAWVGRWSRREKKGAVN